MLQVDTGALAGSHARFGGSSPAPRIGHSLRHFRREVAIRRSRDYVVVHRAFRSDKDGSGAPVRETPISRVRPREVRPNRRTGPEPRGVAVVNRVGNWDSGALTGMFSSRAPACPQFR
jgi:hypothetical protein